MPVTLEKVRRLDHLIPQADYVRLSKININTARNRILKKRIASLKIDGKVFIDINQSPPGQRFKPGHKYPSPQAVFPEDIDHKQLVNVCSFAYKQKCTTGFFYRSILNDEIICIIIQKQVFANKDDLLKLKK